MKFTELTLSQATVRDQVCPFFFFFLLNLLTNEIDIVCFFVCALINSLNLKVLERVGLYSQIYIFINTFLEGVAPFDVQTMGDISDLKLVNNGDGTYYCECVPHSMFLI